MFSPTKFQSHDDISCLSSSSTLQAICIVKFKGKETSAHQHFFPPSFSQQACCLHFHLTALIATYSHPRVLSPTCQGRPIWSAFQCIFHFFCCLGVKDLLLVQEDWVCGSVHNPSYWTLNKNSSPQVCPLGQVAMFTLQVPEGNQVPTPTRISSHLLPCFGRW